MNRRMMKRAVWLVAGTLVAGMGSQVSPVAAQDGKWRMGKPMSSPQGEITSAVIGKKWYVMGGYDGPNVQARGIVTVYDASTDTWTDKKNMQIPAHHAAAVALSEYVAHYHAERNHQGKSNVLLFRRVTQTRREEPVQCRERLGGLLRYYHQEAA